MSQQSLPQRPAGQSAGTDTVAAGLDPEARKRLQELSDEFQKVQGDLQTAVSARQRLSAQQQENLGVKKEFSQIKTPHTSSIYKLTGPILLRQSHEEASMAVDGRLDFIGKELKRREDQIDGLQREGEERKMAIYQLQMQAQGQPHS